MKKAEYDWIVVGGGAAGIGIAEILARLGLAVLLVERNATLASETTKIFHEWLHSGTLYTLAPDKLRTTRYLLGAIDDLLEFYSCYSRMNLVPSESGFLVGGDGWFNNVHMHYRYKSRPLNPLWSLAVARSRWLIDDIQKHDWLRRRAGSLYDGFRFDLPKILRMYPAVGNGFIEVRSPDVTMNSRVILSDLLASFEAAGGTVATGVTVEKIRDSGAPVELDTSVGTLSCRHVAICCADGLSRFTDTKLKVAYAPMFVVDGLDKDAPSFVELDYFVKRCINLINKGGGIGLAGGISVEHEAEVQDYLDYCIRMHKERNPSIRVIDSYVGLKKELVGKGQNRNYLYHINPVSENVWSVVLGKFTLVFSLAPEFIRRIYRKNPPRFVAASRRSDGQHPLLSDPMWKEIVQSKRAS